MKKAFAWLCSSHSIVASDSSCVICFSVCKLGCNLVKFFKAFVPTVRSSLAFACFGLLPDSHLSAPDMPY